MFAAHPTSSALWIMGLFSALVVFYLALKAKSKNINVI